MRAFHRLCGVATLMSALSALPAILPASAQTVPPSAVPPSATPPSAAPATATPADPVVARVGDQVILRSDVAEAASGLPEQYQNMPPATLFPMVLDQLIDRDAIDALARKQGVDKDPQVSHALATAADQVLQNAYLSKVVGPQITEEAIRARYDHDIAGKTGEEEVHARHILVATEAEADKVIAQLKKGADFATLAKQYSTDPGAAQGGDLGFFKKGDMLPAFADAAFAMKPGQISDKPVHTQYGWHVIQVLDRRAAPAPTFEEAHDNVRQTIIQEAVAQQVDKARAGVQIVRFNADGSVPKSTDNIVPPPAPQH